MFIYVLNLYKPYLPYGRKAFRGSFLMGIYLLWQHMFQNLPTTAAYIIGIIIHTDTKFIGYSIVADNSGFYPASI